MSTFTFPQHLPGMKPWVCEYLGPDGHTYGIILHGSDAAQVLNDNAQALPGLKVLGEHGGTVGETP